MQLLTRTQPSKKIVERFDTTYIAFTWATALCQQNLIISMQFLRQLLGGEMLAHYWLAIHLFQGYGHFTMCGSEQHAGALVVCVCVGECLEVRECIGIIISRFSDEKPMRKWLLGVKVSD